MALIPLQHVIADVFTVDAAASVLMGSFVKFDADGEIIQATGAGSEYALGVAGDTKNSSTAGIPSVNDAVIGADGNNTKQFVNRVSDPTDETLASNKMTVYHSGGRFATDQYDTAASYTPGAALYVGASGKLQPSDAGSGQVVGRVETSGAYPSGVPGTDVNGDISLGTYLTFILTI